MTLSYSFRCPTCGEQVFHFKFQADDSMTWREWPFAITCDKCGDVVEASLLPDGKLSRRLKRAKIDDEGLIFAYSNTLPIAENLYYQPSLMPGFSSPYTNLPFVTGLSYETIIDYGRQARFIEENLTRYRTSLSQLYRMLQGGKTHVKAFKRKLRDIFGYKSEEVPELTTYEDCYHLFHELQKAVLKNLRIYDNTVGPLFLELLDKLISGGPEAIDRITAACFADGSLKRNRETINQLLNRNLEHLHRILPALLLDVLDERGINADDHLRLVTISLYDLEDIYKDNFNELVKFLPLFIAIYNEVYNGSYNTFVDANGSIAKYTFQDFLRLTDGNKVGVLLKEQKIKAVIAEAFDHHVRNGIDHSNSEDDYLTQSVCYHYDPSDSTKTKELRWIRLAHMCLMQMRWVANLAYTMWLVSLKEPYD